MNLHTMVRTSVVAAVLALPALALAAGLSDSQIWSVSNLLRSYGVESTSITQVQDILRTASTTGTTTITMPGDRIGTPPMPPGQAGKEACVVLTRNLAIGSRGDDVRKVQELLAAHPNAGFTVTPTGYYGPATARAMARWQQLNGVASSSTGSVGPLTRGFFERACAGNLSPDQEAQKPVTGTISSIGSDSFVLTTPASTTVTVMLTASTTYKVLLTAESSRIGTATDLAVGKTVSVIGMTNADGSIVARKVTINVLDSAVDRTRPIDDLPGGIEHRSQSMRNPGRSLQ